MAFAGGYAAGMIGRTALQGVNPHEGEHKGKMGRSLHGFMEERGIHPGAPEKPSWAASREPGPGARRRRPGGYPGYPQQAPLNQHGGGPEPAPQQYPNPWAGGRPGLGMAAGMAGGGMFGQQWNIGMMGQSGMAGGSGRPGRMAGSAYGMQRPTTAQPPMGHSIQASAQPRQSSYGGGY